MSTQTQTTLDVAIVGAGFSGIGMGIALKQAGIAFTIFDRADEIGGVWHYNTYPGAACDIPSALYSFSFEQRRNWTHPCSSHDDIKRYLGECVDTYGLRSHLRLGTEIADATWDAQSARWTLRTVGGETIDAASVIFACGQLSRPAWPQIAGRERFRGQSFHSAEWDHDVDLRGKRVAVIGAGASAIQFVPAIASEVGHLDLYQRTASYLLPRRNNAYADWARTAIERVPPLQWVRRQTLYQFCELTTVGLTAAPALSLPLKLWSAGFRRLRVRDRELRRKLTPDYPIGCKRILFSSKYYPALQRENVDVIVDPIREITERGIVTADGTERRVDVLIYGTGFRTHDFVAPVAVTGADGRDLQEAWVDGAEAHHGMTVSGFPNMFVLYGPNTNLSVGSIIVMIEAQVDYVRQALEHLRRTRTAAVDVRPEVQQASNASIQRDFEGSVWTSCSSWYRNEQGRVVSNWPHRMAEYERLVERFDPSEYRAVAGKRAEDRIGAAD
jgi:cation diffusion facilitator CzcD-associated flavoprotein CzcO